MPNSPYITSILKRRNFIPNGFPGKIIPDHSSRSDGEKNKNKQLQNEWNVFVSYNLPLHSRHFITKCWYITALSWLAGRYFFTSFHIFCACCCENQNTIWEIYKLVHMHTNLRTLQIIWSVHRTFTTVEHALCCTSYMCFSSSK